MKFTCLATHLYNRTPQPGEQSRDHHAGTLPRRHATDTNQAAGPLQLHFSHVRWSPNDSRRPGLPTGLNIAPAHGRRVACPVSQIHLNFFFLYVQIHGKSYIDSLHFFLIFYDTYIKPSNKSNRFVHFLS